MRFWIGIGTRNTHASVIVQPFSWHKGSIGKGSSLYEIYLGPVTLRWSTR